MVTYHHSDSFSSDCPCVKMQVCPECSKAFTRKDSLQRHVKSVHGYTVENSKGQIVLKNEDCTSEPQKTKNSIQFQGKTKMVTQ